MAKNLIIEQGTLFKTAAGQPGEGPSFQQQFGILANAQITDKYPALSNYQVAVQLLDRSDDNSFAVCAVVYKLGTNFIYVPAVFRNGKIATGQMMQVPSMQRILPLSDAWMSWIKNKEVGTQGQLVQPQFQHLYGQSAQTARAQEPIDPIMKTASAVQTASVFDTVLKLGKKASYKMLQLLNNEDYLNSAFNFYSPQQVCGFAKEAMLKFPDEAQLEYITVMDKRASVLTDAQKESLYRDGFIIKKAEKVDWGPAQGDVKVLHKTNLQEGFVNPRQNCKCEALTQQGQLVPVIVLAHSDRIGDGCCVRGIEGRYTSISSSKWDSRAVDQISKASPVCVIDLQGNRVCCGVSGIIALKQSIEPLSKASVGKELSEMKQIPWGAMLIYPDGKSSELSGSFTKNTDGNFINERCKLVISEDSELKRAIQSQSYIEVPKGTKVLLRDSQRYNEDGTQKSIQELRKLEQGKVPVKRSFVNTSNITRALKNFSAKNFVNLKVTSDGQQISFVGHASKPAERLQVKQAVLHLINDYGVAPLDAKAIIKNAGMGSIERPVFHNYWLVKKAAVEEFQEPANIGASGIQDVPPEVAQLDLQEKAVQDTDDMQTITKATQAGIKQVFDTQTLKLLIQEADPQSQILEALPEFMNTLDKLCRILFIYRCHTDDMEQRYGAIKMKALQKSLQNTIKDLSQLTIFLKLRGLNNGEAPDAGDLQTGTLMQ